MVGSAGEHRLQPVSFGQEHRDVVIGPMERRQVLQEHHQALEVSFAFKLAREAKEEGDGDVKMEVGEAVFLGQVGVPKADDATERQFAHQEVVHPAEGELQVLHLVAGQVIVQFAVEASDQLLHGHNVLLDARLRERVVVLDRVQQAGDAPETVSLHAGQRFFGGLRLMYGEFAGHVEICGRAEKKVLKYTVDLLGNVFRT